jgi:predicted transcriptional regulator
LLRLSEMLRGGTLKTVTLEVRDPSSALAEFSKAWQAGKSERSARIGFATPELLWKVLTAKRWELLKVLCGAGPVSIREAARRVDRDVKAVHSDITALLTAGVLDRTDTGEIVFPYDAVKVEFLLQAA